MVRITPLLLVGLTNPVPPLLAEIPAMSLKFGTVVRIGVKISLWADKGLRDKQNTAITMGQIKIFFMQLNTLPLRNNNSPVQIYVINISQILLITLCQIYTKWIRKSKNSERGGRLNLSLKRSVYIESKIAKSVAGRKSMLTKTDYITLAIFKQEHGIKTTKQLSEFVQEYMHKDFPPLPSYQQFNQGIKPTFHYSQNIALWKATL